MSYPQVRVIELVKSSSQRKKLIPMRIIDSVMVYERVIADLEEQAPTYNEGALDETLDILKHRVWELKNVFADQYQAELAELEASKNRHPAGKALPTA